MRAWPVSRQHRWPVTLNSGPLTLRPLRRRDQYEWERVRRSNASWLKPWEATLPRTAEPGPASFAELVRALNSQARQGRLLPWAIVYRPPEDPALGDVLAGQLTVSGVVGGSASWGQIGYWIDQRWAGRGLVPTAVSLAVDYCFSVMQLHRVEIAIRPENANSLRVVEKLQFRPEGLRPRYLHIDGDWRDHLIFALNREEIPGGLLARWQSRPRPEPVEGPEHHPAS